MYFHSSPGTFSGNEQQPSEIISNGLEKEISLPNCAATLESYALLQYVYLQEKLAEFYYVAAAWSYKHAWMKI